MTDNDIKTICEKIESLHEKILKSKFAETVTESEMLSLILAVRELNNQKAEIDSACVFLEEQRKHSHQEHEKQMEILKQIEHQIPLAIARARNEAIKEFAARLLDEYDIWTEYDATEYGYVDGLVNNLVEKMTGEKLK